MNCRTEKTGFRLVPILSDGKPGDEHLVLPPRLEPMLEATRALYTRAGRTPPWVSYLSVFEGAVVGGGAFASAPQNGAVEIAYFTLPDRQGRGYATHTASALWNIALDHDPTIALIAKTMPEENPSTRVLKRLGFEQTGEVEDHEIGKAWSWRLDPSPAGP